MVIFSNTINYSLSDGCKNIIFHKGVKDNESYSRSK